MGKHVLHKRSKEIGKVPLKTDIEYGEIAINYLKDNETLSIKNTNDEIITLPFKGGAVSDDYVAKSGDTMSGNLIVEGETSLQALSATSISATTIYGNVSGSSDSADKLTTPRTIALSGGVTGSAEFDGSANITIATTLDSDVVTSQELTDGLTLKADKIALTNGLALKADKIALTDGLALKADKSSTYTKTEVDDSMLLKANTSDVYSKSDMDIELGKKANAATTYTITAADAKFATKDALSTGLDAKANVGDSYSIADSDANFATKDALSTGLADKANTATTYTISAIDAKFETKDNASTTYATKDALSTGLNAKANVGDSYSIADSDAKYATQTSLADGLDGKVDKVTGKVLSSNDYTDAEKTKLEGLSNYNDTAVKGLITDEVKRATDAETALGTRIDDKVGAVSIVADATNPLKYTLMVDGNSGGSINIPEDQLLESANYDDVNKKLIFVFKTGTATTTTEINVADLVDEYTAGSGLTLANNVFTIDSTLVALKTDIPSITNLVTKTELSDGLDTKEDKGVAYSKGDTDTFLGKKANVSDVYTKSATDALLLNKANTATTYSKTEVDTAITTAKGDIDTKLATKVDKVDGKQLSTENYTTVEKEKLSTLENYNDTDVKALITAETDRATNAESALGTKIDGKVDTTAYTEDKKTFETIANASATYETIANVGTIKSDLETAIATKQDTLTAGANVTITDNVISTSSAVESVNGQTGVVVLTAADVSAYTKSEIETKITEVNTKITEVNTKITEIETEVGTDYVKKTGDTMTGDLKINAKLSVGQGSQVTGINSFAQGLNCNAEAENSHAEGVNTTTIGIASHAEGNGTQASGWFSHSEAWNTLAEGKASHAEGSHTVANGEQSHAEGEYTQANGKASHAEGSHTVANNSAEHANGAYNVSISGTSQDLTALTADAQATLFSVGNGVDDQNRRNAFEVKYNGDAYFSGDTKFAKGVTVKGETSLQSLSATSISATTIIGTVTGVAENADKLQTARNINLSGGVTGTALFDGSADITIATTLDADVVITQELTDGLATKVDTTAYTEDKATFALTSDVNTALNTKVDVSSYNIDKTGFETKGHADATYETIDNVDTIKTNLETAIDAKQDTLTAGDNVTISGNVISTKSAVESVNTKTGVVVLTAADVNAYTKTEVDTAITTAKGDIDTKLDTKVDKTTYAIDKDTFETKANVATIKSDLETAIGTKQATLTAGANITISTTNEISSTSNVELVQDSNNSLHYTLNVDGDNKGEINIPKDQFLESAEFKPDTNELVFVFRVDSGTTTTTIDISHLVDTYTAGNGLTMADNVFSIDTAITATKASVDLKADKTYVDTELGNKADSATMTTELDKKVDTSAYTADKATFALTTTVNAELDKKFDTSAHTAYVATVNTELDTKVDTSAYTDYVTTVNTALDNKVDKVTGKGLSTNDYTTAEKDKLDNLTNYDDTTVKGLISGETTRATDAESALGTRIDGTVAKTGDTMTGDLIISKSNLSVGSGNTFTSGATTGTYAFAQGRECIAIGNQSHAEGSGSTAIGNYSHAEGWMTEANGHASHAEGLETQADGNYSHAEGRSTVANGNDSHAEGSLTQANGNDSHAEGVNTTTIGIASHAEGLETQANGDNSHAEGAYTVANNSAEHANGVYNVSIIGINQDLSALTADTQATLFSVGNGVNEQNRRNAFEIKYNGDVKVLGTINQGSDRSLKHDITSLEDGILSKVSELNPTRFVMNTDNTNKVQIGFIAQEVEEIFPEFVSSIQMSNKEVKTVNYSMMVSVLCKSIQEMKSEMDEMRKELNELKKG